MGPPQASRSPNSAVLHGLDGPRRSVQTMAQTKPYDAGPMSARAIHLLGPQGERPTVKEAVDEVGVEGPLAIVTAGWEEREAEDEELREHLERSVVTLGLWPRAEEVFRRDPEVRSLLYERYDRLRELQGLYRLRLRALLGTCRALFARTDPAAPDALVGPELDGAIAELRRLDAHHLERTAALDEEVFARLDAPGRPSLARDRDEVARAVGSSSALLIAGGHVGILLNRLRLFGVVEASGELPIVAWSGGAMALAERVVLFHDSPPQGPGDPEVYGRGMGLVRGLVPLPHARHRLRLGDPARVALFARRFAPDVCVPLDVGDRVHGSSGGTHWTGAPRRNLGEDGVVVGAEVAGTAT